MTDPSAFDALAAQALRHFDLGICAPPVLFNLSENATYKVSAASGESWALRIHRPHYQSEASIASELCWAMALRETGVAITPIPVPGRDYQLIQRVSHSKVDGERFAVLTRWEEGDTPAITDQLETSFETLGALSAKMHAHARTWQRPAWFTRQVWDLEASLGDHRPLWGRWRNGMAITPEIELLFERTVQVIAKRLQLYGQAQDRFGLVHGDTRLANLLVDGTQVKILDFDDCGFSWFMYDAATPVSFYEHEPQVPALLEAWKTGYRTVASLAADDEAEIPTFVMLRRLLLVAWIGSHSETELAQQMGATFTQDTCGLCEDYLLKFM